jgi:hypothetical protein
MWHYGITQKEIWGQFEFVLLPPTLVWSTPLGLPGQCGGHMHQHLTSGIRRRMTYGAMQRCGLTSLVVYINDKFHDIRKRNATIRSEIWATNIRSLGFRDIREYVTLWKLILRRLGCTNAQTFYTWVWFQVERTCYILDDPCSYPEWSSKPCFCMCFGFAP